MYREKCCTIASSLPQGPLLPLSNPQPSSFVSGSSQPTISNTVAQNHTTNNRPQQSGTSSGVITTASALQSSPQVRVRQLYWCVDKAWTEPSETWLCIEDPHQIAEDRILCLKLKDLYDHVRGFRGRYLSWKTCLGIKFTSVRKIPLVTRCHEKLISYGQSSTSRIPGKTRSFACQWACPSRPSVNTSYFSRNSFTWRSPSKVEGNNTLEMIPKKVDALLKDKGAKGWGLHAVQGWSLWKIVFWMGAFTVLGLLFVILWLVLVDPKDLQNAFTPGAFLVAILCLPLGIPQFLDAA